MKKHSTLERLDLAREIRILALGLIGSLIMAINIKSFVHTGGLQRAERISLLCIFWKRKIGMSGILSSWGMPLF